MRADGFPSFSPTVLRRCNSHMGKECVPIAIDVPRLNRRSECGYFSPCKQGRGLAKNGVQTLECINKDILNRIQRHPGTRSTVEGWGRGGRGSGSVCRAASAHSLSRRAVTGETGQKNRWNKARRRQVATIPYKTMENACCCLKKYSTILKHFMAVVLDQKDQLVALRTAHSCCWVGAKALAGCHTTPDGACSPPTQS